MNKTIANIFPRSSSTTQQATWILLYWTQQFKICKFWANYLGHGRVKYSAIHTLHCPGPITYKKKTNCYEQQSNPADEQMKKLKEAPSLRILLSSRRLIRCRENLRRKSTSTALPSLSLEIWQLMKRNTKQHQTTSIRKKIQIIILILQWGRFRKCENFPDSNSFHAKTFRIEQVSCKIVKAATRVRKTTLSTSIPIEERISITFWQNIFLRSKKHFTYNLDII